MNNTASVYRDGLNEDSLTEPSVQIPGHEEIFTTAPSRGKGSVQEPGSATQMKIGARKANSPEEEGLVRPEEK